jgi:hypothetical protein
MTKPILTFSGDNVLNPSNDDYPTLLFVTRILSVFSEGTAVAVIMGEAINRVRYAFMSNKFQNSFEAQEAVSLLEHLPVLLGKSLAIAHQRELINNLVYVNGLVNSEELNFSEQNALRALGTISNAASAIFDNAARDYCLPGFLIDALRVTSTVIKSEGCGEISFVVPLMTNPINDEMFRYFASGTYPFTNRVITDFLNSVALTAPERRLSMLLQEHIGWTQLSGVGASPVVDSPANLSALMNSAIAFNHGQPNLVVETANTVVSNGKLLLRTNSKLDVDEKFSLLINSYIDSRKLRQEGDTFKELIIPTNDEKNNKRQKWTIADGVRYGGGEGEIFCQTLAYPGICQSTTFRGARYFHVDMGKTGSNIFNAGITPRIKGLKSLNNLLRDKFGQHIHLELPNPNVNLHRMATTFQGNVDVEDHFAGSIKDLTNILLPKLFEQKAYAGAPSAEETVLEPTPPVEDGSES